MAKDKKNRDKGKLSTDADAVLYADFFDKVILTKGVGYINGDLMEVGIEYRITADDVLTINSGCLKSI